MALIGPMKYLTIGNKTYEIESGGSPDIYWVTYGVDINKTEFESAIADGKLVVLTSTDKEFFAVLQQYYDDYAIFSSVGSLSSGMCVFVTTADVSSSTTVWNDSFYGLETDVFFVDLSSNTLDWSDLVNAKNSNKVIVGYRGTVNNTEYYTFVKYYYNSVSTYYLTFVGNPASSGNEYVRFYYGSGSGTSVTWTTQDYDYSANAPFYGTCATTASTAQKEVTTYGFNFSIGSILGVHFSTANTAATPTLRLNSSGNARSIYVGNSTPNATDNVLKWSANTTVYFMWDGTNFRYITSVSAGTVEPSRGANTWYGTSAVAAATQAKTSTINNFVLTKGSLASIKFTYANTYTSAKITLNINSTGAKDVYYNGTVTSSTNTLLWNAGEVLTFMYDGTGYQYIGKSIQKVSQLTNDSGYTSNTGTVTSVGISNATNGGLSVSGSPVTGSGSITVGHSNVLTSAQTTQAVYPIKIDINGHISSYGNAVTVPTITLNGSATTTPDFYAPTSAGTSNYFLMSSGSGTPSWSQPIKYGTSLPASGDFTGQVFILTE